MKRLLLPLLALCVSCNQAASGPIHDFCTELSAGNWEAALNHISTEARQAEIATLSGPDRIFTGAALAGARCEVTRQTRDSATLNIDTVSFEQVAREVLDDNTDALMFLISGQLGEEQELQVAEAMRTAATDPARPRIQLTQEVALSEQEGRMLPTERSYNGLLQALAGDQSSTPGPVSLP